MLPISSVLPLYCLVMTCSLSCGSVNGDVRGPILLHQRDFDAMRKSFMVSTHELPLIKTQTQSC